MPENVAQSNIPQQWRVEPVKETGISLLCPACHKGLSFDTNIFAKGAAISVDDLTKTDQFVYRSYGQNILAFVAALIVYYYAHQWVNGEGAPLNQGILIPVFIAVIAYTIIKPFFPASLFGGKGIPIYNYKCDQCRADVFFACDGKSLALPALDKAKSRETEKMQAAKSEHLETPCNVSITRLPSMIGSAMDVRVFLNGTEMGILKNGKTFDFTTENSINVLTVKYHADATTNSVTFNAKSGDSVRITLKYSGAILTVS